MNHSEATAELCQATERARQWFSRNRHHYGYEVEIPGHGKRNMQEVFDELLDLVETSVHLDLLSEAFEDRKTWNNRNKSETETEDRAPKPSPTATAHT